MNRNLKTLHGDPFVAWIFLATMLIGPGTWMAIFLRHRRAPVQRNMLAIGCNFLAMIGFVVVTICIYASKLRKP